MPIDVLDAAKLMQLRHDFYNNVLRERHVYRPPLPSVGVDRRFLVPTRDNRFGVPTAALPSRYSESFSPMAPRGPFQVAAGQPFIASTGGRLSGVALRGGRLGFTPDELVRSDDTGFGDQVEEQVKGEIRAQASSAVSDAIKSAWSALVGYLSCWPSRGDLCDPNAVQSYVVDRYPQFHNGFPATGRVINHVLSARRGDGKAYQSKASIDGMLRDLRPTQSELSDYDRRVGDLRRQGQPGGGYTPSTGGGYTPPSRWTTQPQAQRSTTGDLPTGAIAAGAAALAAVVLLTRRGGGKGASLSGVRRRRRRRR